MITLIILTYCGLMYAVFKFARIPVTPITFSLAFLSGVLVVAGIVISWQGGAPVSKQITLTRYIVAMNPQVKGLIKTIHVGMNASVKKGDPLFTIDPTPFEASVNQFQAQLEVAKAQVAVQQAGIASAVASVAKARASESYAKSKKDATEKLVAERSAGISRLRAEQLRQDYDAALAALNEAIAGEGQARAALVAAKKSVKSVEAQLDGAKFTLGQTSYKAPADGMVVNWQAREGTITTALRASAIGTFMDMTDTRVVVVLPQNLLRKVSTGDPVEMVFMSRPGIIDMGTVLGVSKYTGEGQLVASGDLPIAANVGSKGYLAAAIRLDDDAVAKQLALGEAGAAAIYTQPAGPFAIVSKIYLRMLSLMFFLP
jgi:multidrug resistance efflux pump